MKIVYIDRKTAQKCIEKVYGEKALHLLYGNGWVSKILLQLTARFLIFSKIYGWLQKTKWSQKKIAPFIEKFDVDVTEFMPATFHSFNDFFIRKLKSEARPIGLSPFDFVAPADGRYFVYPQFSQFVVKGKEFSLSQFLASGALGRRYMEGSMAIVRLCPTDYHRFHFPVDGVAGKAQCINGPLYSVSPFALRKNLAILSENKRVITEIETESFGTIQMIEIGATCVGSIKQTYKEGDQVCKGQEKGYFEFGGSCIVLLFEKGKITFDADLIANTMQGFETKLNFGQTIGSCK